MKRKRGLCVIWFCTKEGRGRAHSITGTCQLLEDRIEFAACFRPALFVESNTLIVTYKSWPIFVLPTIGIADPSRGYQVLFSAFEVRSIQRFAVENLGAQLIDDYWEWWRQCQAI